MTALHPAEIIAKALAESVGFGAPWESYAENATDVLYALKKAGLVVVPVEPSEGMIEAGEERWLAEEYAAVIYRAMKELLE